jgi:hypothetical protein
LENRKRHVPKTRVKAQKVKLTRRERNHGGQGKEAEVQKRDWWIGLQTEWSR